MKRSSALRQTGASLIELMISMVIGLVIVGLVTSYYLSSRQTYQSIKASSDISDSSRFAIHAIEQQLRLAGYTDAWFGRDENFPSRPSDGDEWPDFASGQVIGATSDALWIRYRPAQLESQPITSCTGHEISSHPNADDTIDSSTIVMVRIDVATSDDQGALRCKLYFDNGASVESGDVAYLLDNIEKLSWEFLDDSGQYLKGDAGVSWETVRAVRMELLIHSSADLYDASQTVSYEMGGETLGYTDQKMRVKISRVISLRNMMGRI